VFLLWVASGMDLAYRLSFVLRIRPSDVFSPTLSMVIASRMPP